MTVEHNIIEGNKNMETEDNHAPLVLKCIDFRTSKNTENWLEEQGLKRGDYYLYASAGATGNPKGFMESVKSEGHSAITAVDHQDCGFYKKNGDDSTQAHHHNLELLGENLYSENPNIKYNYHLLPVADDRHACIATAIILGQPEMVRLAREKLDDLGLADDHDEIARPHALSVDDETLWNDLEISLSLHSPTKILLFEKDEENAKRLMEKIKEIAAHMQVESIMLAPAA